MMDACSQNKPVKKAKQSKQTNKVRNKKPHWSHCLAKLISINRFLEMTQTTNLQCKYQTVPFSKVDND